MKRLFALLVCMPFVAHTQNDLFGSSSISNSTGVIMDARDISGKPIPSSGQIVEGNPMLANDFVNGHVKFKGDAVTYNLLVNFSLADNQLYFKKENTVLKFVNPLESFSVVIKENDETKIMNFKNGYPNIANNDEGTFYQVMLEGSKIQLLKYISKPVREKYAYGGPVEKEYVQKERLYVYDVASKTMAEINPSANSLEKALPNYATLIEKFAAQTKIKHEEDLITMITAINNEPTKKELKAAK